MPAERAASDESMAPAESQNVDASRLLEGAEQQHQLPRSCPPTISSPLAVAAVPKSALHAARSRAEEKFAGNVTLSASTQLQSPYVLEVITARSARVKPVQAEAPAAAAVAIKEDWERRIHASGATEGRPQLPPGSTPVEASASAATVVTSFKRLHSHMQQGRQRQPQLGRDQNTPKHLVEPPQQHHLAQVQQQQYLLQPQQQPPQRGREQVEKQALPQQAELILHHLPHCSTRATFPQRPHREVMTQWNGEDERRQAAPVHLGRLIPGVGVSTVAASVCRRSRASSRPPTTHRSKTSSPARGIRAKRGLSAEPAELQRVGYGVLSPPPTLQRTRQQQQRLLHQQEGLAGNGARKTEVILSTQFSRSPYFAEQKNRDDDFCQQVSQRQEKDKQHLTPQQRAMGIPQPLPGQVFPTPPPSTVLIGPAFAGLPKRYSVAPAAEASKLVSGAFPQTQNQQPAFTVQGQQQQPVQSQITRQKQVHVKPLPLQGNMLQRESVQQEHMHQHKEAKAPPHQESEAQLRETVHEESPAQQPSSFDAPPASAQPTSRTSFIAQVSATAGSPIECCTSPGHDMAAAAAYRLPPRTEDGAAGGGPLLSGTVRSSPVSLLRPNAYDPIREQPASAPSTAQDQWHHPPAPVAETVLIPKPPENRRRALFQARAQIRSAAVAAPAGRPGEIVTSGVTNTVGKGVVARRITFPVRMSSPPGAAEWSPSGTAFPHSAPAAPLTVGRRATSQDTHLILLSSRLPLRPRSPVTTTTAVITTIDMHRENCADPYESRRRRRRLLPFGAHRVCSLDPQRATPPKLSSIEQHLLSLTCDTDRSPYLQTGLPAQQLPYVCTSENRIDQEHRNGLPPVDSSGAIFQYGIPAMYSGSSPPFSRTSSSVRTYEQAPFPRSSSPTCGQSGRSRGYAAVAPGAEASTRTEASSPEIALPATNAAARSQSGPGAQAVDGESIFSLAPAYPLRGGPQQRRGGDLPSSSASLEAARGGMSTSSATQQPTPLTTEPYYLAAVREASDIVLELEERLAKKEVLYGGELLLKESCIAYQRESIRLLQQEIRYLHDALQEQECLCNQAQQEVVLLLKHVQLLRSMRGGDAYDRKLWEDLQGLYRHLKTARERGYLPSTVSPPPSPGRAPTPSASETGFPAAASSALYVHKVPGPFLGTAGEETSREELAEKGGEPSERMSLVRFAADDLQPARRDSSGEQPSCSAAAGVVPTTVTLPIGDRTPEDTQQQQLIAVQQVEKRQPEQATSAVLKQQLQQVSISKTAALETQVKKQAPVPPRETEPDALRATEEQQERLRRLGELIREATNPYPYITPDAAAAVAAEGAAAEQPRAEARMALQQVENLTLPQSALPYTGLPLPAAGLQAAAPLVPEHRLVLPSKEEIEQNERLVAANEQLQVRCAQLAAQVTCLRLAGTGLTKDQTEYVNRQIEELRAYCETLEKQNRDLATAGERALREQERELQRKYENSLKEATAREKEAATGLRADAEEQAKKIKSLETRLEAAERTKDDALAELLHAERAREDAEKRLASKNAAAAAELEETQRSLTQKISALELQIQEQQQQQQAAAERENLLRRQHEDTRLILEEQTKALELAQKQRAQQEAQHHQQRKEDQQQERREREEWQLEKQEQQRQITRLHRERQRISELLARADAAGLFGRQQCAVQGSEAGRHWEENLDHQLDTLIIRMQALQQQHEEAVQQQKELRDEQQRTTEKQKHEQQQQQQLALEQQKKALLKQHQHALEQQKQELWQQQQRLLEEEQQKLQRRQLELEQQQQRALQAEQQNLRRQQSELEQQKQAVQEEKKQAVEKLMEEARRQQAAEALRVKKGDEQVVELEKQVERLQQAKRQLEQQLSQLSERSAQQHFEREKALQKALQEKDMLKQTLVRMAKDSDKLQSRYDQELQQRIQKHKEEIQERERAYEGKLRTAAASASELLKRSDTMEKQHRDEVENIRRQHDAELLALQEARLRDIERHKHEVVAVHQSRKASLDGLQKKHEHEIQLIKQRSLDALHACTEQREQQLERKRLQHESELQQQQRRFNEILEQQQQEFAKKLDSVKARADTALAELQRRNEAELQEVKQQLQKMTEERLHSNEELLTQTAKDKEAAELKHTHALEHLRQTHRKEIEIMRNEITRLQKQLSESASADPSESHAAAAAAAHAARFRRAVGNSVEALQQEIERIMKRLEEARARSTKLESEKSTLLGENKKLDRQLQVEGERRREQDAQLQRVEVQNQQLQKDIETQRQQITSLRTSLDRATAEATKWKKLAQTTEAGGDDKSEEAPQARQQLTRLQLQVDAQADFIKSLKEQLATKERALAQMEGEVGELHRELRSKELKDIQIVSELRKQSLYLEHSKEDAQAAVVRLKAANDELQQESAGLAAKIKSLTEEAEAARQQAAAAEAAAATWRDRGDASSRGSREGETLRQSLQHLEQQLCLVEQQLRQQRNVETRLKEQIQLLQGELEVKEKLNEDYKWQLRQMADTLSETNRRLHSHLSSFSDEKAALQETLEKNFAAREETLRSQLHYAEQRLAAVVAPTEERMQQQQQHRIDELSHLVEQLLVRGVPAADTRAAGLTAHTVTPPAGPHDALARRRCLSSGSAASGSSPAATILLPAATAAGLQRCLQQVLESLLPISHVTGDGDAAAAILLCIYPMLQGDLLVTHLLQLRPWIADSLLMRLLQQLVTPERALLLLQQARQQQQHKKTRAYQPQGEISSRLEGEQDKEKGDERDSSSEDEHQHSEQHIRASSMTQEDIAAAVKEADELHKAIDLLCTHKENVDEEQVALLFRKVEDFCETADPLEGIFLLQAIAAVVSREDALRVLQQLLNAGAPPETAAAALWRVWDSDREMLHHVEQTMQQDFAEFLTKYIYGAGAMRMLLVLLKEAVLQLRGAAAAPSRKVVKKASPPPRYSSAAAVTEEPQEPHEEEEEGEEQEEGDERDAPQVRQHMSVARGPIRSGALHAPEEPLHQIIDQKEEHEESLSSDTPSQYFAEALMDQLLPAAAKQGGPQCLNVRARLKYKLRGRIIKGGPAITAPAPARRYPAAAGAAAAVPWRHGYMQRIPPRCSSN